MRGLRNEKDRLNVIYYDVAYKMNKPALGSKNLVVCQTIDEAISHLAKWYNYISVGYNNSGEVETTNGSHMNMQLRKGIWNIECITERNWRIWQAGYNNESCIGKTTMTL